MKNIFTLTKIGKYEKNCQVKDFDAPDRIRQWISGADLNFLCMTMWSSFLQVALVGRRSEQREANKLVFLSLGI